MCMYMILKSDGGEHNTGSHAQAGCGFITPDRDHLLRFAK